MHWHFYDEVRELTFYQMGRSLSCRIYITCWSEAHFTSSEAELMQAFSFDDHSIWHDQTDSSENCKNKNQNGRKSKSLPDKINRIGVSDVEINGVTRKKNFVDCS